MDNIYKKYILGTIYAQLQLPIKETMQMSIFPCQVIVYAIDLYSTVYIVHIQKIVGNIFIL